MCTLYEVQSLHFVKFMLIEHTKCAFNLTKGLDALFFYENNACLRLVFCEYAHIPIKYELLQKWYEIYIYERYNDNLPDNIKEIIKWIVKREEFYKNVHEAKCVMNFAAKKGKKI